MCSHRVRQDCWDSRSIHSSRENGTLTVATADPFDVYALDELQTLTGLHVQAAALVFDSHRPAQHDRDLFERRPLARLLPPAR